MIEQTSKYDLKNELVKVIDISIFLWVCSLPRLVDM